MFVTYFPHYCLRFLTCEHCYSVKDFFKSVFLQQRHEVKAASILMMSSRRGSRKNADRFPITRALKTRACGGVRPGGMLPGELFRLMGAYHIAKKSGNFRLKSNEMVIFRKISLEIVDCTVSQFQSPVKGDDNRKPNCKW